MKHAHGVTLARGIHCHDIVYIKISRKLYSIGYYDVDHSTCMYVVCTK